MELLTRAASVLFARDDNPPPSNADDPTAEFLKLLQNPFASTVGALGAAITALL